MTDLSDPTTTRPATPELRIVRGGSPTDAQAAAIAAALSELEREPAAEEPRGNGVPAWTRAALTEGVTRTTISTPQHLRDHRTARS